MERPAAETRVRRDDQPERPPHASDLLDRDRIRQRVESGTTLVFRDRDAEPAELPDAPDDVGREAPIAFVLLDDRRHLARHEVADGLPEQPMLGGEVEVHGGEGTTCAARLERWC